jgi:O-antigen/teichoic acid export membrane protein
MQKNHEPSIQSQSGLPHSPVSARMSEDASGNCSHERFDSDLKLRTRRSVVWMITQAISEQGISFIIFILMARELAMAELGTMAIAFVFLDAGRIVTMGGLIQRIAREKVLTPSQVDTVFWLNIAAAALFCIVVIGLAPVIGATFPAPHLQAVLAWSSLAVFMGALGKTHLALRMREFGHSTFAMQTLVGGLVSAIAAVIALEMGAGIWAFVLQRVVREAVSSILAWQSIAWHPRFRFEFSQARLELRFGGELAGARLVSYMALRVQDLILGKFLGAVQLSSYRVAWRPAEMLGPSLATSYATVALQTFSRLQDSDSQLRSAYIVMLRQCALLCVPALVGYAVAGRWLVPAIFGEKWIVAGQITPALIFLAIPTIVGPVVASLLTARGHVVWQRQLALLDLVSTIIVTWLTLRFGLFWIAAAYGLRASLWVPVQIGLTRQVAGIGYRAHFSALFPSILGSAVMSATVLPLLYLLNPRGIVVIMGICGLGAVVYGLAIFILLPQERQFLWAAVNRGKREC